MFHTRFTRIGIVIAVAGLAVLGASLFHWVQTTRSKGPLFSTNDYEWVVSQASSKPALSRDEIWDLPASCTKQFYTTEINNLKATLAAHNATKPPPVILDPPRNKGIPVSPDMQRTNDALDRHLQVGLQNNRAITEVAKIYGPYSSEEYESLSKALDENNLAIDPLWFTTRFHLQFLIKKWMADAAELKDQRITRGEVLKLVEPGGGSNLTLAVTMGIVNAKTNDAKIDVAAKHLLSLAAFSDTAAKTIRTTCADVIPIKQVIANTSYGTDIERWPIETPVSFWAGIALAILGLMFGPVMMWVRAAKD